MDEPTCTYRFDEWLVEPDLNRISRGDEEKRLEPKAMNVLAYLLARSGEVVTADELLKELWPGQVVEAGAIYQRIARIRKAFDDDSHDAQYIETIAKRGYRAKATVEVVADDAALVKAEHSR